ncbi:MAG: sporulation transcription factor Spo0A [Eubacteriales bacterium]
MEKKSIVIIQDNEKRNMELQKIIAATSDLEVVGIATDGIGGYKLIEEKKPDFVVSELLLAGFDGFCILDKLRSSGLETKVILVSAFVREDIVAKALSKGAAFFIAKPYAYEVLIERIRDLDETRAAQKARVYGEGVRRNTLDEKISNIFINVGIPPHIKGYAYLREGVKMAVDNPDIINNITKKLYPMIGERYSTSASKVERAIRHAIEVAWNRGRIESINNILGVRAYIGAEKPTNGEFIALVADKMLLEKVQ